MMYLALQHTIASLDKLAIDPNRVDHLNLLVQQIQKLVDQQAQISLNFICTHNSRRSQFAQVWAHTAARYYNIPSVQCYSSGTEETAVYPQVIETLADQGFQIFKNEPSQNPSYTLKLGEEERPILLFSKKIDHTSLPKTGFVAIMTCTDADQACPHIPQADIRIALPFEDPKIADHLPEQGVTYWNRSLEIAAQLFYVFSKINPIENQS